jgi:glycosyltransferase involved in cell wall biosynthesis
MLASVIVSTRDRARLLDRLLAALAGQTLQAEQYEILVVDDQSADETPAICQRWQSRLRNMESITLERHGGLGSAGNRAMAAARGDCLLFTDDDCIPEPDWIRRMAESLDNSPIVAGAIVAPTGNYFQLCHNIAQFHPFLMPGPEIRPVEFVAGANLGVRREVMIEVGGFDAESPVPDMEWVLRARQRGFTVAFAARAGVTHDPPRTSCRSILEYAAAHAAHTIRLRQEFRDLLRTPLVLRFPTLLVLTAPLIALRTTAMIYAGNHRLWRHWRTVPVVFLTKLAWCRGAARGLRARRADSAAWEG